MLTMNSTTVPTGAFCALSLERSGTWFQLKDFLRSNSFWEFSVSQKCNYQNEGEPSSTAVGVATSHRVEGWLSAASSLNVFPYLRQFETGCTQPLQKPFVVWNQDGISAMRVLILFANTSKCQNIITILLMISLIKLECSQGFEIEAESSQ